MDSKETKKPRKLSNHQIIVGKFVAPTSFSNKGFWPREMKIATKLVTEYNLGFLIWVIPPYGKKVPSLAYFIADYGKQYLMEQWFNYKKSTTDLTSKIETISLEKDKIGDDIVFDKKPRTLKDFLNLYKPTK